MPERSQDLEMHRERFLNSLHESTPDMASHQDFVQYWKTVEREAKETEELGKLEDWVKDLARDKERVSALKDRLEAAKDSDHGAAALLGIIRQILMLLEEIERKLKVWRDDKRRVLGWLLLMAGPGVKKKTPEEAAKGKKEEDDKKVAESVMAKPKDPEEKKPTKQMTR